ncbi:MAG: SDR family oxidoreductase [Thermoleophilia bacterium]|nr:SDR family oxidoreductase [Thermoleophilia bacterium]
MSEQKRLDGHVVAITGGATGIGLVTAKVLAGAGATISIGDLDAEASEKAAAGLGEGHLGLPLDVTDNESFKGFVERTETELGPLYGLINNAGVMFLGPLDEEAEAVTDTSIAVNLGGVINGTRIAMQKMRPRGRGKIVNIASQAGKAGLPEGATYCATKFGVVGLSESVRRELRGTGVEVTCVMPGPVQTELGAGIGAARGMAHLRPEDVAEAILETFFRNRAEVWIPSIAQALSVPAALMPVSGRDWMMRALKADSVLAGADHARRSEYEKKSVQGS